MKSRRSEKLLVKYYIAPIIVFTLIICLLSVVINVYHDRSIRPVMSTLQILAPHLLLNLLLILIMTLIVIAVSVGFYRQDRQKLMAQLQEFNQTMRSMKLPQSNPDSDCPEIRQLYESYRYLLTETKQLARNREDAVFKLHQDKLASFHSQINPSFILNTLNSAAAFNTSGNIAGTASLITGLSMYLDSSLTYDIPLIPLKQELKQAVSYLQIMQLCHPGQITLETDFPDPLPDYLIIKLTLQPFIENCIIHGFKDMDNTGVIKLSLTETPTQLIIRIADNGTGGDTERLNTLLKQRPGGHSDNYDFYTIPGVCRRLHNSYGHHVSLSYEKNRQGGVTACIVFEILALKIVTG